MCWSDCEYCIELKVNGNFDDCSQIGESQRSSHHLGNLIYSPKRDAKSRCACVFIESLAAKSSSPYTPPFRPYRRQNH